MRMYFLMDETKSCAKPLQRAVSSLIPCIPTLAIHVVAGSPNLIYLSIFYRHSCVSCSHSHCKLHPHHQISTKSCLLMAAKTSCACCWAWVPWCTALVTGALPKDPSNLMQFGPSPPRVATLLVTRASPHRVMALHGLTLLYQRAKRTGRFVT